MRHAVQADRTEQHFPDFTKSAVSDDKKVCTLGGFYEDTSGPAFDGRGFDRYRRLIAKHPLYDLLEPPTGEL